MNLIKTIFRPDEQGDKTDLVAKKRRIEYQLGISSEKDLENTLAAQTSNDGSSSMHQRSVQSSSTTRPRGGSSRPVLDHASSGCLQAALNEFYSIGYQRFGMALPCSESTTSGAKAPCIRQSENQHNGKGSIVLSKDELSSLMTKQIENGKDLSDKKFVQSFARSMLDLMNSHACVHVAKHFSISQEHSIAIW